MGLIFAYWVIGSLIPILLATALFIVSQRQPKEIIKGVAKAITTPEVKPEPIENVILKWNEARKRAELLDHQDWEYRFRKLNNGKPWDYKPRIGPPPARKPIRSMIDPDGEVIEIHSWQQAEEEEMLCNPCARGNHRDCEASIWDEELDDYSTCWCDCCVDEDE